MCFSYSGYSIFLSKFFIIIYNYYCYYYYCDYCYYIINNIMIISNIKTICRFFFKQVEHKNFYLKFVRRDKRQSNDHYKYYDRY